jgi:regulator of sigma E protease
VTFNEVSAGSPAESAGLKPGDTLVSVNGDQYSAFDQRAPSDALRALGGQTVVLGVVHPDGTDEAYTVTLRVPTGPEQGALGIGKLQGKQVGTVRYDVVEAVRIGFTRTVDAFSMILDGLAKLGASIITNPTVAPPAAGPVGIADQLGTVLWGLGPIYVVYMIGLLSANLALVNILPFPPLDGGRMLMIGIKAIPGLGKRVSLRAEQLTYAIGFIALFTFLIWITVFDIARQFGGGTP